MWALQLRQTKGRYTLDTKRRVSGSEVPGLVEAFRSDNCSVCDSCSYSLQDTIDKAIFARVEHVLRMSVLLRKTRASDRRTAAREKRFRLVATHGMRFEATRS